MSPINTFTIFSQSSIQSPSVKIQKNNGTNNDSNKPFASLLQSLSTEERKANEDKQIDEVKKLEDTLIALQEIPKDQLTPEDQELLQSIMQMLALQTVELQDSVPKDSQLQGKLEELSQQIEQEQGNLSMIDFDAGNVHLGVGKEKKAKILNDAIQIKPDIYPGKPGDVGRTFPPGNLIPIQDTIRKILPVFPKLVDSANDAELLDTELMSELIETSQSDQDVLQQVDMKIIDEESSKSFSVVQQRLEDDGQYSEQNGTPDNSQTLSGNALETKGNQVGTNRNETNATPTVRMTNLIEELSEVIKGTFRLNTTTDGSHIRVNINPDHLGHLDIRLTSSEGKIAAQIFTSSIMAKDALDLQINLLRSSLQQQGITIDRIEITHQPSEQSFGQELANSGRGFSQQQQRQGTTATNRNVYLQIEDEAIAEIADHTVGAGSVNYTI